MTRNGCLRENLWIIGAALLVEAPFAAFTAYIIFFAGGR